MDVQLNLVDGSTRPYKKPNSSIVYIDTKSNHPPSVLRSVRKTVETRLSMLSSSKEIFNEEKKVYQKALQESGHETNLEYCPKAKRAGRKRTTRVRMSYKSLPAESS